jgi:hypothetical protein
VVERIFMTDEEIARARKKGQLVYRPYRTKDGLTMITHDGTGYDVLPDGSVRRKDDTPRHMSKKERRKWRKAQFEAAEEEAQFTDGVDFVAEGLRPKLKAIQEATLELIQQDPEDEDAMAVGNEDSGE